MKSFFLLIACLGLDTCQTTATSLPTNSGDATNRHNDAPALRGSGGQGRFLGETPCSLESAVLLAEEIDFTVALAEACSDATASTKDSIQDMIDVIVYIRNFSDETSTLLEVLDDVEDFVARFSVFTDKIPKIGSVISQIRTTLNKFLDKVQRVVNKFDDKLEIGQIKLENVTLWLEKLENFTVTATDALSTGGSQLNTAISCSNRFNCVADSIIDGVADAIPIDILVVSQVSFSTCALALAPFDTLSYDVDLPDIMFIQELRNAIIKIEEWIDDAIGETMAGATYAMCCDNVLSTIGDIMEGVSDAFDLATCWTDPAIDSVQDLGIAGLFALFDVIVDETVNKAFQDALPILSIIGSVNFKAENVELPALAVNEETCELEFSEEETFEIKHSLPMDFTVPESIGEFIDLANDVVDAATLGAQIAESCSEALNALADEGEVDCCDVARTCKAEDRIVLYEGLGCTENVAGTLTLPEVGLSETVKTSDQLCLANDEAKSIKIDGPMPAGVVIEIGDNHDSFCADDYTAIVVTKELGSDDSVCISSFESSKIREVNSYYTMYHQRLNGLNGKASRYMITNPKASSPTFTPKCIKPIQLFEGNQCSQDLVALMSLPSSGSSKTFRGNDDFTNDEARSLKLVGPIPSGVRIELFDSYEENCSDDYGSIVTKRALGDYEEICITSFEKDFSSTKYQQTYVPHNGLDGKLSRFQIWNSGQSNPALTCRLAENGESCDGDNDCLGGYCGRGICSDGSTGSACGHDGDCLNSRCVDDVCRAGVNGDPCESDFDCNDVCARGICTDGGVGSVCGFDGDCNNGLCVNDYCRAGVTNDPCEKDSDCNNNRCVKDICRAGSTNDPCEKDSDCSNRRCVKDYCRAGTNGNPCESNSDCNSGRCDGTCKSKLNSGADCNEDSDCKSGVCGWWIFPGECK